jgi:hypothetical protein
MSSFSFGIFITAIAVLACLLIMLVNDALDLDARHPREYWFSWTVFATLFISFLTLLACSFTFYNFSHLFWSLRYDHVKIYEFKGDDASMYASLGIDPSTIMKRHVKPCSCKDSAHPYVTIICAWNNKDVLKNHDSLTTSK